MRSPSGVAKLHMISYWSGSYLRDENRVGEVARAITVIFSTGPFRSIGNGGRRWRRISLCFFRGRTMPAREEFRMAGICILAPSLGREAGQEGPCLWCEFARVFLITSSVSSGNYPLYSSRPRQGGRNVNIAKLYGAASGFSWVLSYLTHKSWKLVELHETWKHTSSAVRDAGGRFDGSPPSYGLPFPGACLFEKVRKYCGSLTFAFASTPRCARIWTSAFREAQRSYTDVPSNC